MPAFRLPVRQLVEFLLRTGSIDSRFTGFDRANEGARIHRKLQKAAGEGYAAEVFLSGEREAAGILFTIEGRADGIFTDEAGVTVIDEIKTGLMITRATSPSRKIRLESARMLRMATIDAAHALRMDDQIGSLEPGKKADMIAVDLHNSHQNPTSNPESAVIYTANQDNVMMTMVDGKILYDNFVHVSGVDRDGIVSAARELRSRISRRVDDAELIEELKRRVDEDRRDRFDR